MPGCLERHSLPASRHTCSQLFHRHAPHHKRALHTERERLTHIVPRRSFKPCMAAAAQGATQRGRRPKQQQEGQRQQQQDNEGGSRSSKPRSGGDSTAAGSAAGWQPDADDGETDGYDLQQYLKDYSVDEIVDKLDAAGLIPEERQEEFPVTAGRNPGYTPFEYVTFTDEEVHHDLTVQVNAPLETVYRIWANRINYNEWFDLIGQVVLHTQDPEYASYFLFYKWGRLPTLELYTTLYRTCEENKSIIERSVDGMELAAGAYFEEKDGGTEVALRVAYLLPEQLREFVGPVGVWGDVNDILRENLDAMKAFVEANDVDELERLRADDQAHMDAELEESNQMLDKVREELNEEGMAPGVGSPAARAEMRRIMEELGYLEEQDRVDEADQQPPAPQPAKPEQAADEAASDAEESDGEDLEQRRRPGVTSTAVEDDASSDEEDTAGTTRSVGKGAAGTRKTRKYFTASVEEIMELARSGKSQQEVADHFGVTKSTIGKKVRGSGLAWPKKKSSKIEHPWSENQAR